MLLRTFADVFAKHDGDFRCTDLIEHHILSDEIPVRQRYRRIPPSQYEEVKNHIQQLIRESCSPYASLFNRMPFGLCNAPSTFQKLMERIFADQSCQSLLLYLDDVIVFSSSFEQHLKRLEIFPRLSY